MSMKLNQLPERLVKPRENGITMSMDKGLSPRQVEDFIESSSAHVDVVKLGFGTSYVTPNLERKLAIYREAGIPYYFGGTLMEAFTIRGQFDDYCRYAEHYKAEYVEVSDGSIDMTWEEKEKYIRTLAKNFTVLSEVGSKDASVIIPPYKWVEMMKRELEAGAWKVIAEARESGTVGVFQKSGETRSGLVDEIAHSLPPEKILWEAPLKAQQVWFIQKFGANVNLGNIAPHEVIPLETLRMGLRGDTFFDFLDK
ncbi:MAG TPA: phosphosulfolactate synthase [Bacteroidetes bacterium]|nr:phosphosulfolactate synthase [Bacteroidota bacterium]